MSTTPALSPRASVFCAVAVAFLLAGVRQEVDAAEGRSSARGTIRVAHSVDVVGERILLGEIAQLEGSARRFADLDLGGAPSPGQARRFSGHTVLAALSGTGADLDRITYHIPASLRVARAWQAPDRAAVEDAVSQRVTASLAAGESIESITLPHRVRLPRGHWSFRAADAERLSDTRLGVAVEAHDGDTPVGRFDVEVALHVLGEVVRATRTIPKGTLVSRDDLEVVRTALGEVPTTSLRRLGDAIGKRTRRSVPEGRFLPSDALEIAPVVERGRIVELELVRGGLRMRERGRALEDGVVGDTVRLVNLRSGRQLVGEVQGEARVRIAW